MENNYILKMGHGSYLVEWYKIALWSSPTIIFTKYSFNLNSAEQNQLIYNKISTLPQNKVFCLLSNQSSFNVIIFMTMISSLNLNWLIIAFN